MAIVVAKRFHEQHPLLFEILKQVVRWGVVGILGLLALAWTPSRDFIGASVPVYRWLLWALIGVALVSLFWHLVEWRRRTRKPKYLELRQLEYLELNWRWRYSGTSSEPYDLEPYCPKCSGQILVTSRSHQENDFRCGVCTYSTMVSGIDAAHLKYDVELLVRQRIRAAGGDPKAISPPKLEPRHF